jgi:hypothetical protein
MLARILEPDGFSEKFYEKLKARLQERPEQPERSKPVSVRAPTTIPDGE